LRLRTADRLAIDRTMAIIDYDLGHYAAARDRLVSLVSRTEGAGERALQLRILANVHAELGDGAATLRAAEQALAAVPTDAPVDEYPYARQARARGLSLLGRHEEALREIDEVARALLDGGRSPVSFELLRARRLRAEFLLRAGRDGPALTALRELAQQGKQTSAVENGLTLDLLGEAEARAGHADAARTAHQAARVALAKQLGDQHPFLIRQGRFQ